MPRSLWASWLLGVALLGIVVGAAIHLSEGEAFLDLAERAEPWWLSLAVALQLGTYVAQGAIWRRVGRAAGTSMSARAAFALSLAKLFADQALPSAGISGSVVVARGLERRGMREDAVKAAVLVNLATYHVGYIVTLAAALTILEWDGHAALLVVLASLLFVLFAVALAVGIVALSGRPHAALSSRVRRIPVLRRALPFIEQADARLVRNRALLAETTALQVAIVLLDAATMWTLLRSLGAAAPVTGVFASFMIASLVRTIGVVPGGLGTFEATSVLTLAVTGTTIPVALAATLLFRGLSFWAPMLPGLWLSRRALLPATGASSDLSEKYWSLPAPAVAERLLSGSRGLSSSDAAARLEVHGPNTLRAHRPLSRLRVLTNQIRSPLLLLLIFAAGASGLTREWLDAGIVLTIVLATISVGYSREYSAQAAAAALQARMRIHTQVLRDGMPATIGIDAVVPGDVVILSAGNLVPADALILDATDFFASEAALTGESFPVEKRPGAVAEAAPLAQRTNCVFLGTSVCSGTARCLVVHTGAGTEFGAIAARLTIRPPETEFDRGIRRFGYLLTSAMLTLVIVVFAVHALQGRPAVETLLFSIALAVGLSPELLPAILNVNLARGAHMMAHHGVLVRRLNAIENLGSMDVLCTDKTGTLTEGVIRVAGAYDPRGAPDDRVLDLAALNASLETGLDNPLDAAILSARTPAPGAATKLAEIPFDFTRKRLSVVVRTGQGARLITKGAFHSILDVCTRTADGARFDERLVAEIDRRYEEWSSQGSRLIAVATRDFPEQPAYSRGDEADMAFAGFVAFLDQPKADAAEALDSLARLGVSVKVITGDNAPVTRHVASLVGLTDRRMLTGRELDRFNDEALWHAVEKTDLFVEVDPRQKERIILALKKMGHVVGFLGDGINDAPAMHAADTSLSVEHAVDVAREAADFVLVEHGLDIIRRGIEEGRRTFANTLKYVLTTTSANLGNMVSMAAASLFLPFLPLLAGQILLNNFLSDIPAIGIADDSVDPELVARPERWDMRFIARFMIEFGLLSSLFDFLTFAVLLAGFAAAAATFRTAWFIESLLTELVIALVVRTRRPMFRSRPGRVLLVTTVALIPLAFAIPQLPYASLLGFVPLPATVSAALVVITLLYVGAAELGKRHFYREA